MTDIRPTDLVTATVDVDTIQPHPRNANEGDIGAIGESLKFHGQFRAIVVSEATGNILAGNHTYLAARSIGWDGIVAHFLPDLTPEEELRIMLADNAYAQKATYDELALSELLVELAKTADDLAGTGWDGDALDELLADLANPYGNIGGTLSDAFLIPPFSVLNARSGPWQQRKHDWLDIGLVGEEGREGNTDAHAIQMSKQLYGDREADVPPVPSIFDPVLTELAYRWFCPDGGHILDPFAGGATRGVVAVRTGYRYTGVEVREVQVTANLQNAIRCNAPGVTWVIGDSTHLPVPDTDPEPGHEPTDDPDDITPVETHGRYMVKRDDLFAVGGSSGGKVRTALHLATGATGVTTAGSRQSPQVAIVAGIAKHLGIPCRVHVPAAKGGHTPELQAAADAGAEVIEHRPGHNTVIRKRSRDDAADRGWTDIPFGMEHGYAVEATARQVESILDVGEPRRIVVPVGSGMSLAGILHGLTERDLETPVIGVMVGADPADRLDEYAPAGWRDMVTLVDAGMDYHKTAPVTRLGTLMLDPIYEAKCLPFLETGDMLWVVGRRSSVPDRMDLAWQETVMDGYPYDLLFTCPPYYDLEQYHGGDADGSMHATYGEFLSWYRDILARTFRLLADDSFAVLVVGEIRDKRSGAYRNFVGDTITAMLDAGYVYYNEAILVTPLASIRYTVRSQMGTRKLGKTHQNILIFWKGDLAHIPDRLPELTEGTDYTIVDEEVET